MSVQTTSNIIMIRPAAFGFNAETAANNTFQHLPQSSPEEIQTQALKEFDTLVNLLRHEGIEVYVVEDTASPVTPDAIFPNNWISFHEEGTVVTYPMFSSLRRQERRVEIVKELSQKYRIIRQIEMEDHESQDQFLEGTGSMVLDRTNAIAYACISPRTNIGVLTSWCETMNYISFTFRATYHDQAIYHTNVMMAIGDGIAVVCLEVVEPQRRNQLFDHLVSFGREVVALRSDQIDSFAGNMLAIRNNAGQQLMVMSRSAHESLDKNQTEMIERHARIISSDVHTIESIGGGSVRCMIAENFLPHI